MAKNQRNKGKEKILGDLYQIQSSLKNVANDGIEVPRERIAATACTLQILWEDIDNDALEANDLAEICSGANRVLETCDVRIREQQKELRTLHSLVGEMIEQVEAA